MDKLLLNILIRTSNRPDYFRRLLNTIEAQTNKNYRLIISADTPETENYVKAAGYNPIVVKRLFSSDRQTFPWNLYLNSLMKEVTGGWILFIDDDDMFAHQMVFKIIADCLPFEDRMLVWRMRFPDGRLVPGDNYWEKLPFVRKQISMPCFAFHSKWKDNVLFDAHRAGDFRFVNQLIKYVKTEWLDIPLVQLSNYGNVGKSVDLQNELAMAET